MRVLCFHPALAPYRVDFFNRLEEGVELKLVLLQRNLSNQKFDQSKLVAALKVIPTYARGIRFCNRIIPRNLLALVKRIHPDVILAYEASPVTVFLCLAGRLGLLADIKIWTSMDDAPDMIPMRKGVRRWVRDWVLRNVDGVIVPSEAAAAEYQKIVHRLVCSVVPIAHDTAIMRANAKKVFAMAERWRRESLSGDEKAVIFVGRLAVVKNLEWLVSQTMRGDWPSQAKLFLVGDGELSRSLSGRVRLLGRHEGDELNKFFAAADAVVLCSHSESFGAVVAEALQWGTPVVVSDRVGARVLVNDANGAVFAHDNAEDFISKLKYALSLPDTQESRLPVDLKAAVRELVEKMHEV